MHYYTSEPRLELFGQTVHALFANLQDDLIRPFLDTHRFREREDSLHSWYPVQDVLDIMNDIAQSDDASNDFVAIGLSAADITLHQSGADYHSFPEFMANYSQAYQAHHRGGNAGYLEVEQAAPNHLIVRLAVPYPDDLMYGEVYGFARRLLPHTCEFTVYYDEETLTRDEGGDETVIHVMWE